MRGKYVIVRGPFDMERPFLMDEGMNHSDLNVSKDSVISAGFFRTQEVEDKSELAIFPTLTQFHCWGKSVSLGKESRGELDSTLLTRVFKEG